MTTRRILAASAAAFVITSGCGTTIDDNAAPATADVSDVPAGAEPALESGAPIEGGVVVDTDTPATTIALTGSATDLLPDMSVEMSRLGSLIADGETDAADSTLERIERIWQRIRPEIEADRPELLNGLGAAVAMARTAVERTQPADADKGFSLLTDLVDQFTGDG